MPPTPFLCLPGIFRYLGIGMDVLAACGAHQNYRPFLPSRFCIRLLPPVFISFLRGVCLIFFTFLLILEYCTAVARNETYGYVDGTFANFLKQLFHSFCTVRSFPFGWTFFA